MKILIVEDMDSCAHQIAEALVGLGEIVVFTRTKEVELAGGYIDKRMPSLEEAVGLIKESDVILLDRDLGTSYSGKELLPYCTGKKVISISVSTIPGMISWTRKLDLNRYPEEAQSLRDLVTKVIS